MTEDTLRLLLVGARICGKYNFPAVSACKLAPKKLIPFNYALTSKERRGWLHFFVDDYQFERLWNNPMKYLPIIKQYDGVIAPDFSMLEQMSLAQQIYNCWRNRVIAAWLQREGVKVIPTVEWSNRASLEWCLEGLPTESTLAVQTNGCFISTRSKADFVRGMDYIYNELSPSAILIYGKGEEFKNYFPNMYFVNSYCQNMKKRL